MKQILEGIRLIEVADWGFVPSAGTVLGDWGADVIKIEHPVRGDPMRGLVTSGLVPGRARRQLLRRAPEPQQAQHRRRPQPGPRAATILVPAGRAPPTSSSPTSCPTRASGCASPTRICARVNPRLDLRQGARPGAAAAPTPAAAATTAARSGRAAASPIDSPARPTARPAAPRVRRLHRRHVPRRRHRRRALSTASAPARASRSTCRCSATPVWIMAPDIVAAMTYGFELPQSGSWAPPNPLVHTYFAADGRGIVLDDAAERALLAARRRARIGREDLLSDPRFDTPRKAPAARPLRWSSELTRAVRHAPAHRVGRHA